jgi:Kef-type K+ transport system membrane component KefB
MNGLPNDARVETRSTWLRGASLYGAMMVAAVGLFFLIDRAGAAMDENAETPIVAAGEPTGSRNVLVSVLVTLAAVVAAGQVFGRLFRAIGQPPVIGEVLAGIALGPSLLGRVWPEASQFLLPPEVGPVVGVIAQIGVILYMFLVGLELNPAFLRNGAGKAFAIAHASIAVPFVGGAALALFLYPRFAGDETTFTTFALFSGVALSVTAFPVLARILSDRRMQTTTLGMTALSAAAAGDATAWCLLAFIVGIAKSAMAQAVATLALTILFVAILFSTVRPLLERLLRRHEGAGLTPAASATIFVAVFASAVATEAIGIHALFGAFLLGAITPHDSRLALAFAHKLEDVVTVLLLPAFFASVGLRTEIGLVSGLEDWLICGLIIVVATVGKFGGTYAAARLSGMDRRSAAGLGALMNTRGLMELIVLNIGLEMKVISPTLFAMMVIMAVATTVATGPALRLLRIDQGRSGADGDSAVHEAGEAAAVTRSLASDR